MFKLIVAILVVMVLSCTTNIYDPIQKPLELLYPKGGESFKADSLVVVRWLINDTKVSSVIAKLSTNNGTTYDIMLTSSGSVFPPQTSVLWTTNSAQESTQCRVKICDCLNKSIQDQSGVFTVHN